MTEALRGVIAHEFGILGTRRITATCETDNLASARVMSKAGMRYEQTIDGTDFEGNWAQRFHYAIERE
jgi:RimJ/RimL family protein N-acetyltransferase